MFSKEESFDTVSFVLVGIFFACIVFSGLAVGKIPAGVGGLALLTWVALAHIAGLAHAISKGHTNAAIIILVFAGFWLCLGLGLQTMPGQDVHELLLWIEPAMFLVILLWQLTYRKVKSLQHILWGLDFTIAWLWVSKFVPVMKHGIAPIVLSLGIWALGLAFFRCLDES